MLTCLLARDRRLISRCSTGTCDLRKGTTLERSGKLVASWTATWNSSTVRPPLWNRKNETKTDYIIFLLNRCFFTCFVICKLEFYLVKQHLTHIFFIILQCFILLFFSFNKYPARWISCFLKLLTLSCLLYLSFPGEFLKFPKSFFCSI